MVSTNDLENTTPEKPKKDVKKIAIIAMSIVGIGVILFVVRMLLLPSAPEWIVKEYNKPYSIGGLSTSMGGLDVGAVLEISLLSVKQTSQNKIEIEIQSKCLLLNNGATGLGSSLLYIRSKYLGNDNLVASGRVSPNPKEGEVEELKIKLTSASDLNLNEMQSLTFELMASSNVVDPFSVESDKIKPSKVFSRQ